MLRSLNLKESPCEHPSQSQTESPRPASPSDGDGTGHVESGASLRAPPGNVVADSDTKTRVDSTLVQPGAIAGFLNPSPIVTVTANNYNYR